MARSRGFPTCRLKSKWHWALSLVLLSSTTTSTSSTSPPSKEQLYHDLAGNSYFDPSTACASNAKFTPIQEDFIKVIAVSGDPCYYTNSMYNNYGCGGLLKGFNNLNIIFQVKRPERYRLENFKFGISTKIASLGKQELGPGITQLLIEDFIKDPCSAENLEDNTLLCPLDNALDRNLQQQQPGHQLTGNFSRKHDLHLLRKHNIYRLRTGIDLGNLDFKMFPAIPEGEKVTMTAIFTGDVYNKLTKSYEKLETELGRTGDMQIELLGQDSLDGARMSQKRLSRGDQTCFDQKLLQEVDQGLSEERQKYLQSFLWPEAEVQSHDPSFIEDLSSRRVKFHRIVRDTNNDNLFSLEFLVKEKHNRLTFGRPNLTINNNPVNLTQPCGDDVCVTNKVEGIFYGHNGDEEKKEVQNGGGEDECEKFVLNKYRFLVQVDDKIKDCRTGFTSIFRGKETVSFKISGNNRRAFAKVSVLKTALCHQKIESGVVEHLQPTPADQLASVCASPERSSGRGIDLGPKVSMRSDFLPRSLLQDPNHKTAWIYDIAQYQQHVYKNTSSSCIFTTLLVILALFVV